MTPWTVAHQASLHGILQARILEWVPISFSKGSSRPRDQTDVSCISRQILHHWATREANLFYEVTFQHMKKENFRRLWVKRPEEFETWRKNPLWWKSFNNTRGPLKEELLLQVCSQSPQLRQPWQDAHLGGKGQPEITILFISVFHIFTSSSCYSDWVEKSSFLLKNLKSCKACTYSLGYNDHTLKSTKPRSLNALETEEESTPKMLYLLPTSQHHLVYISGGQLWLVESVATSNHGYHFIVGVFLKGHSAFSEYFPH